MSKGKKWLFFLIFLAPGLLALGCNSTTTPMLPGMGSMGMGVNLTGFITSWTDAQGNPLSMEGMVVVRGTGMQTTIQPDGRFQFTGMPTGMHTLVFQHPTGVAATLQMTMHDPGDMHITVQIQGTVCNVQEQHYRHGDEGELHGMVIELGTNAFTLHAVGDWFTIRYSATTRWEGLQGPQDLAVGLHVEVEGRWVNDNTMDAERVARMDESWDEMPHQEWCGIIMQVGNDWFWLHGTQIYYDANTRFVNMNGPQDLQVGILVEADVVWQSGRWYARQVERKDHCDMMADHG